jgi:hypothetical protein
VYSATCDIVCICETWLNATVLSSELLPGYSIFRRDRVRKIGGGVLVAVKNNIVLHVTRRLDLRCRCQSTLLYTFYRPPDSCPDAIQHLNSSLQDTHESSCVILIGDLTFLQLTVQWIIQPLTSTAVNWKRHFAI